MIISFLACILLSDYLVRSGPIEIYINNDSIIGDPDGSLLKPYRTLLDAFESNSNSNVEFWFSSGTHILDFELPENTIQGLSATFKSLNENPATLSIINRKFMFPNVNVIELYLENLIIKASNVGNCTYLFSEYLGYAIENSSCSTEEEIGQLDLINLDSSTTLHITNATFSDFNYGLRSIISTTGGKINLNNVNFHKISLYNTIWSEDFAVIRIACDTVNTCDDCLHYDTGTVREIGNKIDEELDILAGFLYAINSGKINMQNLEFNDNFYYYNYRGYVKGNHFIHISDSVGQIIFTNNYFRHFYTSTSFIYIFYWEIYLREKDIENNKLIQSTNIIFENNTIDSCYSDSDQIYMESDYYPLSVKILNNRFENSVQPYSNDEGSLAIFKLNNWIGDDWDYDTITMEIDGVEMTFSFDPLLLLFENNKFVNVVPNSLHLNTFTKTTLKNIECLLTKSVNDVIEYINGYAMTKNLLWFNLDITDENPLIFIEKQSYGNLEIKNLKFSSWICAQQFRAFKAEYIWNVDLSDVYIENLCTGMYHAVIDLNGFEAAIISNLNVGNMTFDIFESDYDLFSPYVLKFLDGKQLEFNNLHFDWDEYGNDIYIQNVESVFIENIYMQNTNGSYFGSISVLNCKDLNISHMYIENSAGINSCVYLDNVKNAKIEHVIVRNSKMSAGIYVKESENLSFNYIEIYGSEGLMTGGIHISSAHTTNLVELLNIFIENTSGNQYSAGIYIESYVTQTNAKNITMKDLFGGNYGGFVCEGCKNVHLDNINFVNITSENTAGIYLRNTHIFLLNNTNFDTLDSESNTGCLHLEILNELNPSVIIDNVEFLKCIGIDGAINLSLNPNFYVALKIKNSNFIGGMGKLDASALKISEWYQLSDDSVIDNCNFSDNHSLGVYGILNLRFSGFMTIINSIIQNNIIQSADSIITGYFKTSKRSMMIKDSKFINNSAKTIIDITTLFQGTIVQSENCEFTGNRGKLINLLKIVWNDYNSQFVSNENVFFGKSNTRVYLNSTKFLKNKGSTHPVMYFVYSSFDCQNCIIDETYNEAISLNFYSKLYWKNVTFRNNKNPNMQTSLIDLSTNSEKIYLIDCDFYNNIGRVINIIKSNVEMENILIENNLVYGTNHFLNINAATVRIANLSYFSEIEDKQSPILSGSSSVLYITNSDFYNKFSHGLTDISLDECQIEISNSKFSFNKANSTSPYLQATRSNLKVLNCDFNEINLLEESFANVINLALGTVEIENTKFNQFSNLALYGVNLDSFNLTKTQFINGAQGCIVIYGLKSGIVSESKFSNINSFHGGSIFVESTSVDSKITISRSDFTSNTAKYGGCVYLKNIDSVISNNDFLRNSAEYGGAIYFSCTECKTLIERNHFSQNSAQLSGGSMLWTGINPKLVGNEYSNNEALYGMDISSYPTQLAFDNKISRVSLEIASSQKVDFPIKINLIDDNLQVVKFGYDSLQSTIIGINNTTVSGVVQAYPVNGTIIFDNIYVTAEPETIAQLVVLIPSFKTQDGFSSVEALALNISLNVRQCKKGEYLFNDKCIKCEAGTYSFSINENCNDCPIHAFCYGQYYVAPYPGYWHGSNTSEIIYECLSKNACLGGLIQDIGYVSTVGKCREGYKGSLCGVCDDGYSSEGQDCGKCPDKWVNIIRIIGASLLLAILTYIAVVSTMKSSFKSKSIFSIYLKIFINYLQLVSLACQLRLNWPNYVQEFLTSQERAGKVTDQILSIDCLMMDQKSDTGDKSLFFDKLVIFSLLPVGLLFLLCVFWSTVAIFKKDKKYLWSQFVATSLILFFIIYPSLTNYLFSAFSCVNLYGQDYLVANLDIKCWDDYHSFYALSVAFPAILVWSIGVPLLIFFHLKRNRRNLHKLSNRMKFGFLYNGYMESAYFWEFVNIFRNLSFIGCFVIFNSRSVTIQALVCLTIILVYLYLLYLYKPYQKSELNNSEMLSIFVSAITIYSGLYYLAEIPVTSRIILFIFILFSNAVFLFNLTFRIFISGFYEILIKIWVFEVLFEKLGYNNNIETKSKITLINKSSLHHQRAVCAENVEDIDQIYLASLKNIEKLSVTTETLRSEARFDNFNK